MPPVFLIGLRASGKTSTGKALARRLNVPFIDTDELLQQDAGRSVAEIVAAEGWDGFRDRESAILRKTAELLGGSKGCGVAATGGGMVLRDTNRRFMHKTGNVVFLSAPVETLVRRLSRNALESQRPSLTGQDIFSEMAQIATERMPLYKECAHHIVDATQPQHRLCAMIMQLCRLHPRHDA